MAEDDKVADFFAKFDRSKKREGFGTFNAIAQKTQQKIEANALRMRTKKDEESRPEDDEWRPIENAGANGVMPFNMGEEEESTPTQRSQEVEAPAPVKEKAPEIASWKPAGSLPVSEQPIKEEPPKPVTKFVPGQAKKVQPKLDLDTEFPALDEIPVSSQKKANRKKKNGHSNPIAQKS